MPTGFKIPCCMQIYIPISSSHWIMVLQQLIGKRLSHQSEKFLTWGRTGNGDGVSVDSAQKFVALGFNSFTPSLHFNGM